MYKLQMLINNNLIIVTGAFGLFLSIALYLVTQDSGQQIIELDMQSLSALVLFIGIFITALFCVFLYVLNMRRDVSQLQIDSWMIALDHSEIKNKAILDNAVDCIITIDRYGIVDSFNPAAERLFGYQADEVIGNNVNMLMPEPYRSEHDGYIENYNKGAVAGIIGIGREVTCCRKDGTVFPVELAVSEVHLGEHRMFTGVVRDISERKQVESELVLAKTLAEQASRAKSEFLSSMSHELRTPLNAILGFSRLFQYDKNLTAVQKNNAEEIHNAGKHLLSLIDGVLDLEKIESGNVELSLEPTSLANVFEECKILVASLAESQEIGMEFLLPECGNPFVIADNVRLKQVFLNLLSNAIKYNHRNGHVCVDCTAGDNNTLRVRVADTGTGIARDKMDGLFQPFNRLGAEFGDTEGTGIGLVITRQLVELMGGELGVDSVEGEGSTFWVDLNLCSSEMSVAELKQVGTTAAPASSEAIARRDLRILVAEDMATNQDVLRQQLEMLGYNADFADNGAQAYDKWQSGQYCLLLTDLQMPVMNGFELVAKLREAEKNNGRHTPVIAITANAMQGESQRCIEAGMDDYISKPVDLNDLQRILSKWWPENDNRETESDIHAVVADTNSSDRTETGESIDLSMLQRLIGDDTAKHCRLLKSFIESAPETIREIKTAYTEHNIEGVVNQSHKLKSPARSMGAAELADTCQKIETAGKQGQWDVIDSLVPELNGLFNSVELYVREYCGIKQVEVKTQDSSVEDLRILLVDDDRLMIDVVIMELNELGIRNIIAAISGEAALLEIDNRDNVIDAVMCDLNMPGMDGVEFIRHLSERNYAGGIVIMSGEDARILKTVKNLAMEHRLNILGTLEKPFTPKEFTRLLGPLNKTTQSTRQRARIQVTAQELKQGINNDELVAYFQPKVDVVTRKVVGMETLVRWIHPEKGMIPPDVFISVAEEHHLIDILTQDVVKKALKHTAALHAEGFMLNVAINISVDTLNDLNWPDYVAAQALAAGIEPSSITLEITESRLMDNIAAALEILSRLSLKKFKLSIDDFGTGYSSMEQLQRVPFTELKIDRAFVGGSANDASARAILESSAELARKLNMSIVAEGVETQDDWDRIAALGCDLVQGYFVAKPMPIDEFSRWLREWNLSIDEG